jgi:hypothetical protein
MAYIYNLPMPVKSFGAVDGQDFGQDFINDHVLKSKFLVFAIRGGATIGYASLSEKVIQNNKFYYFEFLVVDPDYQNIGLSKKNNNNTSKKNIFKTTLIRKN